MTSPTSETALNFTNRRTPGRSAQVTTGPTTGCRSTSGMVRDRASDPANVQRWLPRKFVKIATSTASAVESGSASPAIACSR
jgi:hypothetical protein